MENQIIYEFASAQVANRFLNELRHWSVAEVDAKLYQNSKRVRVEYVYNRGAFDNTCSKLDDLASQYYGIEVNG